MIKFKKAIKNLLPDFAIRTIVAIIRRYIAGKNSVQEWAIIKRQPQLYRIALQKVREKALNAKTIKVAFFAIYSSVWKYEGVYRLLEQDPRFDPIVVICPVATYDDVYMLEEMKRTYDIFKKKGYTVVKTYIEEYNTYLDVKREIAPDVIFYSTPYQGQIKDDYYITNFKHTLTIYAPYGFIVSNLFQIQYNQLFHNVLWKAYYETAVHEKIACQYARNRGKNVIISGYPGTDHFVYSGRSGNNVWKNPDQELKRIIWAPHHTIDVEGELSYSCFLRYHQILLILADKYKDKIQFAFKPHPLLKMKLNQHDRWGPQRTNKYYQEWQKMSNGQLETDDYVDLFNTSDAMILDSASFIVEYLFCGKPSLFLLSDENVKKQFNEFGKLALDHHYQAFDETQMIRFIEDIVIKGEDTKMNDREKFYKDYLIPPNNQTASENIYTDIINAIYH